MIYRYNRYLCRHLIHSMLLITFSLTSIVWLTQALRFIDFIVNQGVSIRVFLTLTMLLVPSLLYLVLPVALLCSVLFVYNKLRGDSELVVMQAVGLSRMRLALPALQVAAAVTLLSYLIALYLLPLSQQRFRDMQSFLRNNYVSIMLQEGVFANPVEGLTVFIRERDETNILHGILVHDSRQRGEQRTAVTMMAEQGQLVETPQGPRFLLANGNRQEMKDGKLSFLTFDRYTLDISLYTQEAKQRNIDPQELFLGELFSLDENLPRTVLQKRWAEGHQRLLWPAYNLTMALVALAVLLTGEFNRRGQPKRIFLAVGIAVIVIFAGVGLRGAMGSRPEMAVLAYLNVLVPLGCCLWALSERAAVARARRLQA